MGEAVFTTSMVGYQETLTDSAFYGKLVAQTFPLIGNYGVNEEDDEAPCTYPPGYIIREWCEVPSNFRSEGTIDEYLKRHGIVGIYDIDTRKLTRILREEGEMNGVITTEPFDREELLRRLAGFRPEHAVGEVSTREPRHFENEQGTKRVAVLDFGVHRSMIEALLRQGCSVDVLPCTTGADTLAEYDGVFLPDGPESEAPDAAVVDTVRALCEKRVPVAGVGLGHLILALANGGTIRRMKYGHRGGNQPVIDQEAGQTRVTGQNHGCVVDRIDDAAAQVSFYNANDKTCEGLRYREIPAISVQFMPEDSFYQEWMQRIEREGKPSCH